MTEAAANAAEANPAPEEEQLELNRREFLNIAWLASLGIVTLSVSGMTLFFAYPRFREGEFGGVFTFGPVSGLPSLNEGPQNFPKGKYWMSNTEEGLYAIYKVCPHLGCLYGWSDQENKFICPCHGSQYEKNGAYILGPAPRSLDLFVMTIVDEDGNEIAQTPPGGGPVPVPDNENAIIRIDTGNRINGENNA